MENPRLRKIVNASIAALVLVGALATVSTLFASRAESQMLSPNLLREFNLSGYPATMRPPVFHAVTAAGQVASLGRLAGKVVLINFWATWCYECRVVMPAFERLHLQFSGRGLSVMGINAREGSAAVRAYAKELGLTYPLVMDPKGKINAAYGVVGLPTTFLIGRDGRAVALAVGPREWESPTAHAIFQALLAEPSVPNEKQ